MITIKDLQAREKMKAAGERLAEIFVLLEEMIRQGVSTLEIDSFISHQLKSKNMVSQTVGYMGYKHSSCISVNDEVVHGVPSDRRMLADGDLVKVDVCAAYNGYCADMTRCFFIGQPADAAKKLVDVAEASLWKGIEKMVPGGRLGDISSAIQEEIEKHGYGVVRTFAGHGIGKRMHEEPEILNYGKSGKGPELRAGMTFALEPMITAGHYEVFICPDGWTAKTVDGSLAAHIEDTVMITEHGPKVLTRVA